MQKYVDNAISSTLNMKESTTVQEVFDAYMDAWRSGCKGLTIFRENCKRTAILSKPKDTPASSKFNSITPVKRKSLGKVSGSTIVKHTACSPNMYVTINSQDGNVLEVFTNTSTGCQSNINTITRMASLALRSGVKVEEVIKELRSNTCPACTVVKTKGTKNVSISCGAAIAESIEEIYTNSDVTDEFVEGTKELLECPECKELTLPIEAKCPTCSSCGYSKCD
jgi:ribonucleoside-diphosphate reductase alpha chain